MYLWRAHKKELRALKRERRHFIRGVVFTATVMIVLFYAVIVSAQIPDNALRYKRDLMRNANAIWGIGAPIPTFAAQIHQESNWNPDAVSRVGAQGMAQFMPGTSNWIGDLYRHYLGTKEPYNPIWAIRAMVTYDQFLYQRVTAINSCEQMAFALAAYNGGLGWTNKRKQLSQQPLKCLNSTCDINPGITPANQKENQEYPRRILLKHEPLYVSQGFGSQLCTTHGA